MDNRILTTFSSGSLETTAAEWRETAGEDAYEVELVPLFDFCRTNRAQRPGYAWVRGLLNQATGRVDAILETVPSPQRQSTKLLKIWISPDFWLIDDDSGDAFVALLEVHLGAYLAMFAEATSEDLAEVKMYGRTAVSLHLLASIQERWDSTSTGWTATMQGRWLSMRQA